MEDCDIISSCRCCLPSGGLTVLTRGEMLVNMATSRGVWTVARSFVWERYAAASCIGQPFHQRPSPSPKPASRWAASQGAVRRGVRASRGRARSARDRAASFVGMRLLSTSLSTINTRPLRTACSILQARCDARRVLIPPSLLPRVSMPHTVQVSQQQAPELATSSKGMRACDAMS